MGFVKSETALRGILGDKIFQAFKNVFDPCCNNANTCCPTEKYTITATATATGGCSGGSPVYSVKATPIVDLDGNLSISIFASRDGAAFSFKAISGYIDGLVAGQEYANAGSVAYTAGHTWEIFVVDSRGNWSNIVSITTTAC